MIHKDKYGDVLRRSSMVDGEGVGDDLGLFPTDNGPSGDNKIVHRAMVFIGVRKSSLQVYQKYAVCCYDPDTAHLEILCAASPSESDRFSFSLRVAA